MRITNWTGLQAVDIMLCIHTWFRALTNEACGGWGAEGRAACDGWGGGWGRALSIPPLKGCSGEQCWGVGDLSSSCRGREVLRGSHHTEALFPRGRGEGFDPSLLDHLMFFLCRRGVKVRDGGPSAAFRYFYKRKNKVNDKFYWLPVFLDIPGWIIFVARIFYFESNTEEWGMMEMKLTRIHVFVHTVPSRGRFLFAFPGRTGSFSIIIYHHESDPARTGTRPRLLGIYLWTGLSEKYQAHRGAVGEEGGRGGLWGASAWTPTLSHSSTATVEVQEGHSSSPHSIQSRPEEDSYSRSPDVQDHFLSLFIIMKVILPASFRNLPLDGTVDHCRTFRSFFFSC